MWIRSSIATFIKEVGKNEKDVVYLSMPPIFEARSYWIMWAFGNHIRVSSAKEHLTTWNNGVAANFEQECVSGPNDQRLVVTKVKYVDGLKRL